MCVLSSPLAALSSAASDKSPPGPLLLPEVFIAETGICRVVRTRANRIKPKEYLWKESCWYLWASPLSLS